jgi:hypothetical protein
MTRHDDRFPDMLSGTRLDAAIDQALNDATAPDDVAPFAGFVADLRLMAHRPAPRPSAELAALLVDQHAAEPDAGATVTSLGPRRRRVRPRAATRLRVAALGLSGKAAIVIAFATTAVAGAATGILPEPASHFVRRVIEVVTPFELPGRDAPGEDASDTTAAGNPGRTSPDVIPPLASTAHRPDAARTPTLNIEPVPEATPPAPSSSDTAIGSTIASPHTNAPGGPHPSNDADNGRPPDHQPPGGPVPKNGHIPPGHAPPGAPHPGGGPGDAPRAGPGSGPEPLSTPKGPPPKVGSPGGSSPAPGRHGPHHRRRGGPGPASDPGGQAPPERPSHGPDKPQCPGPSPEGDPGRAPDGQRRHDGPAPPNSDGRGSRRRDPGAAGGDAPRHTGDRSGRTPDRRRPPMRPARRHRRRLPDPVLR